MLFKCAFTYFSIFFHIEVAYFLKCYRIRYEGVDFVRRSVYDKLVEWKAKPEHKPLIIYGASQIGKTYLIEEFAKKIMSIVVL